MTPKQVKYSICFILLSSIDLTHPIYDFNYYCMNKIKLYNLIIFKHNLENISKTKTLNTLSTN